MLRNRDHDRRRDHFQRDTRSDASHRGINDRWKHDKFEEEEEKRSKSTFQYLRVFSDVLSKGPRTRSLGTPTR